MKFNQPTKAKDGQPENEMKMLELIPAYGRRYQDTCYMEQDWQNGKDFKVSGGPYCSIRDIEAIKNDGYDLIRLYPNLLHEHYITIVL